MVIRNLARRRPSCGPVSMWRDFDRVFDDLERGLSRPAGIVTHSRRAAPWPRVLLKEDAHAYHIIAEVPAVRGDNPRARTHISATMHGNLCLVPLEEVRYFQADQKYVSVVYPGGLLLIDEPLKALEAEFEDRFLRVHRNALVAVRHVVALERGVGGRYQVRFKGIDQALEVSRRLLTAVKNRVKGL